MQSIEIELFLDQNWLILELWPGFTRAAVTQRLLHSIAIECIAAVPSWTLTRGSWLLKINFLHFIINVPELKIIRYIRKLIAAECI